MTSRSSIPIRVAGACLSVFCFSLQLQAQTSPAVLTFEGLRDGEAVNEYYSGGRGSLGSGPGPTLGVRLSVASARLGTDVGGSGEFTDAPSPSSALFVPGITTIDVVDGFSRGLSFFYINQTASTEVRVYDGPNQTGRVLAIHYFATTPSLPGSLPKFVRALLVFPGIARSVAIVGRGTGGIYLDNLTLGVDVIVPRPTRYSLVDLGPINAARPGWGVAPGTNRSGQLFVPTQSRARGDHQVVFWDPATQGAVDIGSLGGPDTMAAMLNDAGQITGWSSRINGTSGAFIWDAINGIQDLGGLGGASSAASGLNNIGQVVGWAAPADGPDSFHAFLWQDGTMVDLNDLSITGRESWHHLERAYSISDTGVIVGTGRIAETDRMVGRYFALIPASQDTP